MDRYLLNGASIVQEPADSVTYWHVELVRHAVLFAEGLPCESYLDTGNRAAFTNGGGVIQLHPDFTMRIWETKACAPLVLDGAELIAARSYVLVRAQQLGYAFSRDPALYVMADGHEIMPEVCGRQYRFQLPEGTSNVSLRSRSAVPAEVWDDASDYRKLGIAVSQVVVDNHPVALTDAMFSFGWRDLEHVARGIGWRWTDGDAGVALR